MVQGKSLSIFTIIQCQLEYLVGLVIEVRLGVDVGLLITTDTLLTLNCTDFPNQ